MCDAWLDGFWVGVLILTVPSNPIIGPVGLSGVSMTVGDGDNSGEEEIDSDSESESESGWGSGSEHLHKPLAVPATPESSTLPMLESVSLPQICIDPWTCWRSISRIIFQLCGGKEDGSGDCCARAMWNGGSTACGKAIAFDVVNLLFLVGAPVRQEPVTIGFPKVSATSTRPAVLVVPTLMDCFWPTLETLSGTPRFESLEAAMMPTEDR